MKWYMELTRDVISKMRQKNGEAFNMCFERGIRQAKTKREADAWVNAFNSEHPGSARLVGKTLPWRI